MCSPSRRDDPSARTFIATWVACMAAIATVVTPVADGARASEHNGPGGWVGVVKVLVGVLLVVVAARQ